MLRKYFKKVGVSGRMGVGVSTSRVGLMIRFVCWLLLFNSLTAWNLLTVKLL